MSMHSTYAYALRAIAIGALLIPTMLSAAAFSELHLTSDGAFSAKGLTVIQRAGTSMYTRASWGRAFIRVTVLTNASTTVVKNYGEQSSVGDITEGHVVDVEGTLAFGADSLIIDASRVRNTTLLKESKAFSGVITGLNQGQQSFKLFNSSFAVTNIMVPTSTSIVKGARTISFAEINEGDSVISAGGTYDYARNTLAASSLEIYQDKAIFSPRNFQGTIKNISGFSLPTTLAVSVGTTEYHVYLPKSASVLSRDRVATSLRRFAEGDTVRFYGAIRETNFSEVDAEVIRDLDF